MFSLSLFVWHHRKAALLIVVLACMVGAYFSTHLPVAIFPDLTAPRIIVTADSGDTPIPTMLANVTRPLENAVAGVPGITRIKSLTQRGSDELDVNFAWGTEMQDALQKLQANITQVQSSLPAGTTVSAERLNPSVFPIMGYSLYSNTVSPQELRKIAMYTLRPRLLRVDGVQRVDVLGGDTPDYLVTLDPGALLARGVTVQNVTDALAKTNEVASVGYYDQSYLHNEIMVNGLLKDPADISAVTVAVKNRIPVSIGEVGRVSRSVETRTVETSGDGHDAVLIDIIKQPTANTIQIADDVNAIRERSRAFLPAGVTISNFYDQSQIIKESQSSVMEAIVLGGALALIVLMFFLGNLRAAAVVLIILPLTILITFGLMKLLGQTMNIMTLGALAIALGLVIDDGIVVVENMFHELESGKSRRDAIGIGLHAITPAMVGSSLTTMAAFLPLVMLSGLTGQFFGPLAIVMVATLGVSLLLALLLVPILAEYLLPLKLEPSRPPLLSKERVGVRSSAIDAPGASPDDTGLGSEDSVNGDATPDPERSGYAEQTPSGAKNSPSVSDDERADARSGSPLSSFPWRGEGVGERGSGVDSEDPAIATDTNPDPERSGYAERTPSGAKNSPSMRGDERAGTISDSGSHLPSPLGRGAGGEGSGSDDERPVASSGSGSPLSSFPWRGEGVGERGSVPRSDKRPGVGSDSLLPSPPGRGAGGEGSGRGSFARVSHSYGTLLRLCLRRWPLVVAAIIPIAFGAVWLYGHVQTGFFPEFDEGGFVLDYQLPYGTSLEETSAEALRIETIIGKTPEVAAWSRRTGAQLGFDITTQDTGDMSVRLKSDRKRGIDAIMDDIRNQVTTAVPGAQVDFHQILQDNIGDIAGSPSPVEVKIFGDDPAVLTDLANKVDDVVSKTPGVVDDNAGIVVSSPETVVDVNTEKAEQYGLTADDVRQNVQAAVQGAEPTSIQEGEEAVGVRVRIADPGTLSEIPVASSVTGGNVPLGALATLRREPGTLLVNRENQRQMIAVTAGLSGRDLGSATADIQRRVAAAVPLPAGYSIEYGGLYESQQQSFHDLAVVLATSVLLVFLLLVIQLRSFGQSLALLAAAVLSLVGVLLGLFITKTPLNISSMTGAVMIVGIVTENGIVLFDYFNSLSRRSTGLSAVELMVSAGEKRLRPILMTTIGAILALFPLALGIGAGAALQKPLAIAVIGGLTVSTFFTLIVAPVLYVAGRRLDRLRITRRLAVAEDEFTTIEKELSE